MTRLPEWKFFLWQHLPDILEGAAAVLEDERARHTPDYWATEHGHGEHARADEMTYHDTDAGMWESGE